MLGNSFLERVVQGDGSAVVIMTTDGDITFMNLAARQLVGLGAVGELDREPTRFENLLGGDAAEIWLRLHLWNLREQGFLTLSTDIRSRAYDDLVSIELSCAVLRDGETRGAPAFIVALLRVTEPSSFAGINLDYQLRLLGEAQGLQTIFSQTSDLVLVLDANGNIRYVTPSIESCLGYRAEEVIGVSIQGLLANDLDVSAMQSLPTLLLETAGSQSQLLRMRKRDSSVIPVEVRVENRLGDANVGGVIVTVVDISERALADGIVASQSRILEMIAFGRPLDEILFALAVGIEEQTPQCSCSILITEHLADGPVLRHVAAPSLPDVYHHAIDGFALADGGTPCSRAAFRGSPILIADLFADEEWESIRWLALECDVATCWSFPVISPTSGDTLGTLALYARFASLPDPVTTALIERSSNLVAIAIERARYDARLRHQATHDELTALPNRSLLLGYLEEALERHSEGIASVPLVVFLDIDRLKVVNDSLGHEVGDQLLRIVAQRLNEVVDQGNIVARFGGDEFVIICAGNQGELAPGELATKLLAVVAVPIEIGNRTISVSASLGIVVASGYNSASDVLRDADTAMHRAKSKAKGSWEIFSAEMGEKATWRLNLEEALRRGIERNEFFVLYQPVVDVVGMTVVGVEALVRWRHPQRGVIGPGEFIELAEETGLIVSLGEWVLANAVNTVNTWDLGSIRNPVVLAVNLSAHQLGSPQLLLAVRAAVACLKRLDLSLEITESTLMGNSPEVLQTITELSKIGTALAIDDFGTGYSSLAYLTRLPVSTLKIDRSFVSDLGLRREAEAVAAAVIGLGNSLGLKVVAEGVETFAQQEILRELGCRYMQGFLYSPPVEQSIASDFIRTWPKLSQPLYS